MQTKKSSILNFFKVQYKDASLTVEAALVMPIFLYLTIALLYFIQIFTIQEQIQSSITKMGLNLSKTAYFCKDFPDINEILDFDVTIFDSEFDIGLDEMADSLMSGSMLKLYAMKYLDTDKINNSCVVDGFDGLSFSLSSMLNGNDYIDIIVGYNIKIPIQVFSIGKMNMLQRVRLRAWTGYDVATVYGIEEEEADKDDTVVYITETGSVYHKSENCSHIKLNVTEVKGIPTDLRNDSGGKYYSCESCGTSEDGTNATYYITSDGTRYHSRRNCSRIKRSVQEILLSEVGGKSPCKRCGQ